MDEIEWSLSCEKFYKYCTSYNIFLYKKNLDYHYIIGDRMKKAIILGICFIIGLLIYHKNDEIIIPSDAIRIRIIANGNNIDDIKEKIALKESIKNDLYNYVKDASNSMEADKNIIDNIDNIKKLIANKTNDFNLSYGLNYFPQKIYKGVVYQSGNYKSLVISLGKGLGDNWWCVLYPPLCMLEDNENATDVQYQSLILNLLKN